MPVGGKGIGIFDFETSNLDADYGRLLVVCHKEFGEGTEMKVIRADDYKEFKEDIGDDRAMAVDVRDQLEDYVMLVGQFSVFFDMAYLQARLLSHGERVLSPLPRSRHIDTWFLAKRYLKLSNNKLGTLGRLVGAEAEKTAVDGRMWARALRADAKGREGLDYIVDHCVADVLITEKVFDALRPFVGK
jgi:uncharacterized protein YprB with RNaseH-like and TPR domain